MREPDFFSSLDDVAEALDDFVKAWNKFVELISEYGALDKGEEIFVRDGPIPDHGKAMIREVLDQWPSVPSFEILLDDSLMAEATVRSFFGGAPTLPPSIAWPQFVFRKKEKRSMSFLAQVDCAELTRLWPDHPLPKAGFLYFFDSWSAEDGLSCPSCRVIHSYDVPDPKPRAVPSDSIAPRDCLLKYRNALHTPRPGDETSLAYPMRRLRLAKGKVSLPLTDHLSRDLEFLSHVSDEGLQKFRELFDEVYGDLRIAS